MIPRSEPSDSAESSGEQCHRSRGGGSAPAPRCQPRRSTRATGDGHRSARRSVRVGQGGVSHDGASGRCRGGHVARSVIMYGGPGMGAVRLWPALIRAWRYAPAVTAGEMLPDTSVCRELASALRAGDDSAAAGLAARAGIPHWLLTHLELGPRGRLDVSDAGEALACISGLAAGRAVTLVPWPAKPTVIDLVAEAVETAAVPATTAEHTWAQGIAALEASGRPALPLLLRARAEEGSGRSDRARQLIESCLRVDPDLLPAVRDAMEYELCAGNWARAWELASAIGSDDIAEPLLRPLDRLQQPARGAERAARNQPCPWGQAASTRRAAGSGTWNAAYIRSPTAPPRCTRWEAEGKDTGMLPDAGELRRRLGIPAGSRPFRPR